MGFHCCNAVHEFHGLGEMRIFLGAGLSLRWRSVWEARF